MKNLNEWHLCLACVFLSLIGLTGILLVINHQEPTPIKLENAKNYTGKYVSLKALVSEKYVSKTNTTFLTLENGTRELKGVIFKNTPFTVIQNQAYTFTGTIKTYKGKLEIVIENVKP